MNHRSLLLLLLLFLVSCADSGTESTALSQATLAVPGQTPTPCCRKDSTGVCDVPLPGVGNVESVWDGTQIDLVVADVMSECQMDPDTGQFVDAGVAEGQWADDYLSLVQAYIHSAVPEGSPPYASKGADPRPWYQRWIEFRKEAQYNCDPQTLVNGRAVQLAPTGVLERIDVDAEETGERPQQIEANGILRVAGVNLCIAQKLRTLVPGAAGGEAIVLTEAQQRQLLDTVRQRAQVAMLQYAALGVVFAAPRTTGEPTGLPLIPRLQWWASQCEQNLAPGCTGYQELRGHLFAMGRDMATAVQLHITASEELLSLMARNRSAHTPTDRLGKTRGDGLWGPASWYQRLLAAAFGGEALAVATDGPWSHPLGAQEPGQTPGANTSNPLWSNAWPERENLKYFQNDVVSSQVWDLLGLARRFDLLRVVVNPNACNQPLSTETAKLLYERVETELRKSDCYVPTTAGACSGGACPAGFICDEDSQICTGCDPSDAANKPAQPFPDEDYLLWNKYRITPQHATELTSYLLDAVDYGGVQPVTECPGPWGAWPYYEGPAIDVRAGAVNATRSLGFVQDPDASTGTALKIDKDDTFAGRGLRDEAPKYTRYGTQTFLAPWEIDPDVSYWPSPGLNMHRRDRSLGAMSSLVAVRQMLMWSTSYLASKAFQIGYFAELPRLTDYFAEANATIELINGAIGEESVNVRPFLQRWNNQWDLAEWEPEPFTYRDLYYVEGTFPQDDAFWQPAAGVTWELCALHTPLAGNLAAFPDITLYGETIGDAISIAENDYHCGFAVLSDPFLDSLYGSLPRRWQGVLPLKWPFDDHRFRTLVAIRRSSDGDDYRLLGSHFSFDNGALGSEGLPQGQYLATGGSLGNLVAQQAAVQPTNPVQPAFDAFGLPTNWTPPLTADLIGGPQGQPSSVQYLALAKSAASDAAAAVEKALDGLVEEQANDQEKAAAAALAHQNFKEARDAVCGQGTGDCDVKVVSTKPDLSWYPGVTPPKSIGACTTQPDPAADPALAIYCVVDGVYRSFLDQNLAVAKPVLDQINSPSVPSFSEYSGGELQSAFIEQWTALKAPAESFKSVYAAWAAAEEQIKLAKVILDSAQKLKDMNCSAGAMREGLLAGLSLSAGAQAGASLGGEDPGIGLGAGLGLSWSPGPWLAQKKKCDELALLLPVAKQQVVASMLSGYSGIVSAISGAVDAQSRIRQSSAQIAQLLQRARLAKARLAVEDALAVSGSKTSFGLYRRYRAYDLWRAKALVENARRYALAARRSIESRYVVNLSTLSQPEPFVSSPATWADEVYGYDLSLPAAVGLAVGTGETGGIYTNKVTDYVSNLEAFVAGFAVIRPSAVAQTDIDVITLPGLEPGSPAQIEGVDVYPERGTWFLRCVDDVNQEWVAVDPLSESLDVCEPGRHVDRARLRFVLDPWGGVNNPIAQDTYQFRYNARWTSLAVNFVGTGVKDCTKASDPAGCYSQAFIRYDLTHVGPSTVTDFGGVWQSLGVPIGRIEGGKGLAAELWLDPLKDGWNTSYIGAVARSEYAIRPFGGAYELEFTVDPEVVLERIERVQILAGSSYWVQQQ